VAASLNFVLGDISAANPKSVCVSRNGFPAAEDSQNLISVKFNYGHLENVLVLQPLRIVRLCGRPM